MTSVQPQVDFYLISNTVTQAKYKLASRLCNKLSKLDKSVLVLTEQATDIDELEFCLWQHSDASFTAHDKLDEDFKPSNIHIGDLSLYQSFNGINNTIDNANYDVLINLCQEIPDACDKFSRIAEIVDTSEIEKQNARNRYRTYQSKQFQLKTHNIEL